MTCLLGKDVQTHVRNRSTKSFFVIHAGVDGNMVVTESNGDGVLGPDSGEIWPTEIDTLEGNPTSLSLEEKAVPRVVDQGEEISMTEEILVVEDCPEEQPQEDTDNCERLSPNLELEGGETEPAGLETIFIAPLDGSLAELRTRVIKEVRKPGRSE